MALNEWSIQFLFRKFCAIKADISQARVQSWLRMGWLKSKKGKLFKFLLLVFWDMSKFLSIHSNQFPKTETLIFEENWIIFCYLGWWRHQDQLQNLQENQWCQSNQQNLLDFVQFVGKGGFFGRFFHVDRRPWNFDRIWSCVFILNLMHSLIEKRLISRYFLAKTFKNSQEI